jgi:hypothetical protein
MKALTRPEDRIRATSERGVPWDDHDEVDRLGERRERIEDLSRSGPWE